MKSFVALVRRFPLVSLRENFFRELHSEAK
jgi:hypothetical protein